MLPLLKSDFEVGWFDIKNEDYTGYSSGYGYRSHCAVGTTNGAGAHNVQIFVLSPDKVVLHALPGFWAPEDLARELRFAKVLHRLWQDDNRTLAQKRDMYRRLQTLEPRNHPAATFARSAWQPFDVSAERGRHEERDTALQVDTPAMSDNLAGLLRKSSMMAVHRGQGVMKPLNMLVHERMAVRPFVPFDEFDIEKFVDYGRMFYDLNLRHREGKKLAGQTRLMQKRRIAAKNERIRARRRG
ncbi:MAG: hypothetical protein VX951_06800 [Planctomycetota bacterium]|nr:hypothetical protein [Planctomycetota bacterium]